MTVLPLARARVLLWARQRGGASFEVSKVVNQPLQPLCPTSPRCPTEARATERRKAFWVDPSQPPPADCAYEFTRRGDCLRHRNQVALEAALFRPGELQLTRKLLEALGFEVSEETIDPSTQTTRVLDAHRGAACKGKARVLHSPVAGPIVLVRHGAADEPEGRPRPANGRVTLRVLPVGPIGGER